MASELKCAWFEATYRARLVCSLASRRAGAVVRIGRTTHEGEQGRGSHFRLEDYLTEIIVSDKSPLFKKTVAEIDENENYHLKVLGLIRDG
ncbi:MAG TPA: hypothetical protein VIF81_06185, partial [Pyrinomonadaceae bacterium]